MKFFLKNQKLFLFFIFICILFSFSSSEEIYFSKFYNQTSFKDKEIIYTINLPNDNNIIIIFIDILVYAGDVEVNVIGNDDYQKMIIVNHIILKIKVPTFIGVFTFSVKAKSNSYYLLFTDYDLNINYDSLISNELQTGFSYLLNINPNKRDYNNEVSKIIKFNLKKYNEKKPIMSYFFNLNCEIKVKRIYNDYEKIMQNNIIRYENLFHDLIMPEDIEKFDNSLEYKITIIENDPYANNRQLCQLFASSVEISEKYEENINDIIIPDNIPQLVMFSNVVKHVTYGYMHLDYEKGLMIKFFPKHIAQYRIRLYFDHQKRKKEEIIIGKNVIFLNSKELSDKCKNKDKGCYIQLDITLENIKDNENPVLEFSFQMIGTNSVSYISKRILKNDFLHNNDSQYYYTEIAQNEEGFITVNFLRGIGKVYYKVVEEGVSEENGDWRGKYSFPDNSKSFYYSNRKGKFDTLSKNCINGCYLLIKIFSNFNNTENITEVNFPFSIIVNSFHKNIYEYLLDDFMPVINIQKDEFVVGTVDYINDEKTILEFYSILLTSNAKQVLIDFQSDTASLYINIGNQKPSTDKYNFKYEPKGKDGIFTISEEEILEKSKKIIEYITFTGLKDIILTLGIKTNIKNSYSSNIFGFVVRLMNKTENDIYKVNSDKKALCKNKMISKEKYRCVYLIENYYISSKNFLLIYPISQNESALFKIYGKYVNKSDYSFMTESQLNDFIPNEKNAEISNQDLNGDYLLINKGLGNLLVTVETNIDTTIELISSIHVFQKTFHVNNYEPKLFFGFKDRVFKFNLPYDDFPNYMVNMRCIRGSADIYWDSNHGNIYHLEGKDNRISITTEELLDNNLNFIPKSNFTKNIGIIFYLRIQPRTYASNLDELILDSSNNYFYSGNDLPINYFASIPNSILNNNEYEIFFSFEFIENDKKVKKYYEDIPFSIESYIVEYDIILRAKLDPDLTVQPSNEIKGNYDPLLKTGYIKITKSNINPYIEKERPYLFLAINKIGNNKDEKYYRYSLEVTAIKNETESPVSESSYQFGKLEKNQKERKYKLRVDNSFKYMFIKFSCSNNDALSIEVEGQILKKKVTEYGRSIYSLEIDKKTLILYLKIKRTNNKESEEYFTFQYIHGNNDNAYKEYKIMVSSKLDIKKTLIDKENKDNKEEIQRANFTISLNPVEKYENYNITYLVRGIDTSFNKNYKIKKEDLSLKFLPNQYYLEYNNPKVNDNKTLIFNFDNITENIKYIQVIAQIRDKKKERLEYLSYDIYNEEDADDDDDDKDKKLFIMFISFGAVILIIVIILVFIVISYHCKNKGLIDIVNKTSFSLDRDSLAESESSTDILFDKRVNDSKK